MLKLISFLLFLSFTALAMEEHAKVSLQRFTNKLVVTIDHEKGWHTYWKNPGDAGLPSTFKFSSKNKPVTLKDFEWPTPHKYVESGNILTIGYSDRQHFFFENIQNDIEAHIGFLICKDICIPGEAKLNLPKDKSFASTTSIPNYSDSELKQAFDSLPTEITTPAGFEYYLTRHKDKNLLTLHYSLKNVDPKKFNHDLLFLTPFPRPPFGFKRESLYTDGSSIYGKIEIEWDGEYQEPPVNLPLNGSFDSTYELSFLLNSPRAKKIDKIKLKIKDFSVHSASLDDFYKSLKPLDSSLEKKTQSHDQISYLNYLLLAFLGGLILNLMPCVLPVISLKLFGLIQHQNLGRKKLFTHNLSYSLGVLFTFLALALVVAGLKATGEQVGWGFQLQSPAFILFMMIVLFILSLNLFGLFEFRTPGGNKLGNTQTKDSLTGDFFSGVLTTILSTPCSAPFLGTALTFAFTTNFLTIFVMFFAIGLGLCAPFLLTAAFPATLSFLPRPGAWMEKLKYFLGLSLIGTTIWLYDVLINLIDLDNNWRINLIFVFWFFAFFFYKHVSKNKSLLFLFFFIPVGMTVVAFKNLELRPTTVAQITKDSLWKPWSLSILEQEKGRTIFMDFTAEWCLTCKVNKKLVLETEGFEELAKKYNLLLLRADWTKRDDVITNFLMQHQSAGVPAYFIQKSNGERIFLGETISISKIEKNLN